MHPVVLNQEELKAYRGTLEPLSQVELCWELDKHKVFYEMHFPSGVPNCVVVPDGPGYRVTFGVTLREALIDHLIARWLDTYTERHQNV